VLDRFEDIIQQHEKEVHNVSIIRKGHLLKFLTEEVRKVTQLKCDFPKIDKYIKRFNRELPILKAPRKHHTFSHNDLCNMIFEKWEKYGR
jgi:hypothetical protein